MSRTRIFPRLLLVFIVALVAFAARQAPAVSAAPPTDLFISEYIEGSSNNKAIEIYNGTGATVNLATGMYDIQLFSNGATTAGLTISLTGSVADGDVYVVAASAANAAILAQADQTSSAGLWNGDDALVLRKNGAVIDSFGIVGNDPGTEWGTGLTSTADNTLVRKSTICAGETNTTNPFDPATEWDGYAVDTTSNLGSHTANCGPVTPVINEFSANTTSTDVEYIEFYGTPNTDYSAYTLLGIEGDSATAPGEGVIDNVIALGTTDASGFYTANLVANTLENGTISFLLVEGFSGAVGNDLDTDEDGILDSTPWTAIIDDVAVNDGGATDSTYAGTVLTVAYDGLAFAPGGASRIPDGQDTNATADWVRNDFDLAGIPPNTGTPVFGEAYNTPNATNQAVSADAIPSVTSTSPADNATGVAVDANITVTFSEAVTVSGAWYTISCATSGTHTATVSGGPTTYTLNPDSDFTASELCTVTIESTLVADQDGTADNMAADYVFDFEIGAGPQCGLSGATPIHDIQGNGAASPIDGNAVTIEGVVVGDFQQVGSQWYLRGFFVQEEDAEADADSNTSEGIFVEDGANPPLDVQIGDVVRVSGTVQEYFTLTRITSVSNVEKCSSGATVTPATLVLPFASADYPEPFEGMSIAIPQTLYVTETFELGRFGEVWLSSGTRLPIPTHVAEPGAPALAVEQANALNRILLDDGQTLQNPDPLIHPQPGGLSASNTLRGGDTTTGLTGVLTFSWGGNADSPDSYRIHPTGPVTWSHDNPRPITPPAVGGSLRVASYNVLNYFITLNSRGANNAAEFERQHNKIIKALLALDADVVGLIELENHNDADPAGDGEDPVLESIVDALNAELGSTVYDFIDTGVIGTDVIKTAFIYKVNSVTPVGDFAILDSSVDPDFDTSRNRPALAQTFEENASGEMVTVVVNHLKSKGSGCGAGDDQPDAGGGSCNGTRTRAAEAMAEWLATDPTGSGDPDVLIIGDLNSYAKEDPIDKLLAAGYTDLMASSPTNYSYVYDGEWGYLDYALSNATLTSQVTGTAAWHTNADEPPALDYNLEFKSDAQDISFYDDDPFRASDHDPILIGLDLTPPPDTTPPTVTINQAGGQLDPTSTSPINFTVVFSEPVTGFETGDVTLSGTAGATTATVTEIAPMDGTTYNVAVSGMIGSGTVIATIAAGVADDAAGNDNAASTSTDNTVDYVVPVAPTDIYVSTVTAGSVGAITFGNEDILKWDGSAWSVWFDGSAAGLMPNGKTKHNINAFSISESGSEILMSFVQNARVVPGIPGKVDGMDLVEWDGSAFSLVFDGQDVGLTVLTHEKIDALQELDPSLAPAAVQAAAGGSCQAYYLISTAGNGKVPNYTGASMNISGEDVLGFCATQLGSTTAGKWHMLLDGSAEGVKPNAIVNISASDDGQTLYFTTRAAFNVGGATGGHSMIYSYDLTTGDFSGPHFSAPATGLSAKIDGLEVDGPLP